jgi:hypothetical protein
MEPKARYSAHKSPAMTHILGQTNPIQIFISRFLNTVKYYPSSYAQVSQLVLFLQVCKPTCYI